MTANPVCLHDSDIASGIMDIPFEKYLAIPAASKSRLAAFAKAPALVHVAIEETAAMQMGSSVHCAILEPNELEQRYQPIDLDRRGTKVWTAAEEAANGRKLIKLTDWNNALRMRDAVWAHSTTRELLKDAITEQSVFWTDEEIGLDCKARFDAINHKLRVLIDIKTCCDASPWRFARTCADQWYGLQDVHYRAGAVANGFIPEAFVFVAVERSEPFLIGIYEIDGSDLEYMAYRRQALLSQYSKCLAADFWPGYSPAIAKINLPKWHTQEI